MAVFTAPEDVPNDGACVWPQITNLTQALIGEFNYTLAYNPYPTPGANARPGPPAFAKSLCGCTPSSVGPWLFAHSVGGFDVFVIHELNMQCNAA